MKSIFTSNNEKRDSKSFGLELLTDKEMLNVRGGGRPQARPKDEYEYEED